MVGPEDDYPHPVPPQAHMTWKENWVFCGVDPERRVASVFHVSLRPAQAQGVFSAKLAVDGAVHRYVGRREVPRDLAGLRPLAEERLTVEVLEPARRFRVSYRSPELEAGLEYAGRFPPFDFADGPPAPGESTLGEIGRHVFPFSHYEQALAFEGTLAFREGPRAGETLRVEGYGNRDHSWGWRDDFQFRFHHWLCASFDDRFVQGSLMLETSYPEPKHGGFLSSAEGNVAVSRVDPPEEHSHRAGEPLPEPAGDRRYLLRALDGSETAVVAHLGAPYGALSLDFRSEDRTRVYQDRQVFCDFTLEEKGRRGTGVLELGAYLEGPGAADRAR